MKYIIAILGLMLLFSPALQADDWPQFGGPERDHVWREDGIVKTLPDELTVKWEVPVALGYAGPAVADGRVLVTDFAPSGSSSDGVESVQCYDASTGQELWRHEYPCRYKIG